MAELGNLAGLFAGEAGAEGVRTRGSGHCRRG
jgi:hypothetical protein